MELRFTIELDREDDGRFIAEVRELPGALAYGATEAEAIAKVKAVALQILAGEIEAGERDLAKLSFDVAA